MNLFYSLLHFSRILVVNCCIDFTAPLMVRILQLASVVLPAPAFLKWHRKLSCPPNSLMLKGWCSYCNYLHWTIGLFLWEHPSPALDWKELFGRWIDGRQEATQALPRLTWSRWHPQKNSLWLPSHAGGPLRQRWKVISLCFIIPTSRIWLIPDWGWGKACGHCTGEVIWPSGSMLHPRDVSSPEKCIDSECPQIQLIHCSVLWLDMSESPAWALLSRQAHIRDISSEFKAVKGFKDASVNWKIVQMAIFPKLIFRFNSVSIKI